MLLKSHQNVEELDLPLLAIHTSKEAPKEKDEN